MYAFRFPLILHEKEVQLVGVSHNHGIILYFTRIGNVINGVVTVRERLAVLLAKFVSVMNDCAGVNTQTIE